MDEKRTLAEYTYLYPADDWPESVEVLAVLDAGMAYEWDTLLVLKYEDRVYLYHGSGCSCNDISMDFKDINDVTSLPEFTWERFETMVDGMWDPVEVEKTEFKAKVSALVPR